MTQTSDALLEALPPERREALAAVRDTVRAHLPDGLAEGVQYGMLSWFVPHSRCPEGYHCDPTQPIPFASAAWTKGGLSLHLFFAVVDGESLAWLEAQAAARGITVDAGKGCLRFKRAEDVPLDLLAGALQRVSVDEFLARYEASVPEATRKRRARARAARGG